jgi:hypothetical protein
MARKAIAWLLFCLVGTGLGCGRRFVGRLSADAGGDGPVVPDFPEVCTSEGWCWTHPLPTSDRFVQAFAVGPDDLWLIGASGTIVRFAGGVWSAVPSPTSALSAIWATAPNDVWVGSPVGPYHWDGGSWTMVPTIASPGGRPVHAIWGCASNDVWVVGSLALHWDGSQLTYPAMPILPGALRAVWGSACDDVWAGALVDGSGAGRIMRWDGANWFDIASQPAEQIAGTGPDDIWSLAQGQLFHWTAPGAATLHNSRTLNLFPVGTDAVGTMDDRQAISIVARNGATSSPAAAPDAVSGLWGRAANDIWGFGALGVAAHWNGTSWTEALPGWALTHDDVVKVTGSGPTDLWAIAGGTVLYWDGELWRPALTPQQVGGTVYDVWARAPDDVWVLGGDALIHRWNGAAWRTEDPPPRGTTSPDMRAISGTGPDDVWILRGTNSVLHWDGQSWISRQPIIERPVDIWAAGPDEAWVVGDDGVSHWQDGSWNQPRLPVGFGSTPLTAVAGSSPGDVWMLAAGYLLKVSDDQRDVSIVMSSDWRAAALAPIATGGVWVVFEDGIEASRLYRVTNTDPSTFGTAVIGPAGLNDLWLASDGTLWAAGDGGALVRKRPAP